MLIYKTRNKINGKIYVGQDSYENPLYLGSGILLNRAILKYGIENFEKEILEKCDTQEKLNEREIFWIEKLNSRNPRIGYNISSGGSGGDTISHNPRREEICKNLSKRNIELYQDKSNHPFFGKTQSLESNERRRKAILGTKRSKETRDKQSKSSSGENNSAHGKLWIHNIGENKLVKKEDLESYLIKGWKKGMIFNIGVK
jgi:group I intron endonuclease